MHSHPVLFLARRYFLGVVWPLVFELLGHALVESIGGGLPGRWATIRVSEIVLKPVDDDCRQALWPTTP